MHGFREAACNGGCVSRKEGTIGLLNGVSAACLASHVAKTRSACVAMVALVGPYCSPSRGSQDSVDSAVIIAGASESTL